MNREDAAYTREHATQVAETVGTVVVAAEAVLAAEDALVRATARQRHRPNVDNNEAVTSSQAALDGRRSELHARVREMAAVDVNLTHLIPA